MERPDEPKYSAQQYGEAIKILKAKGLGEKEIEDVLDKAINSAKNAKRLIIENNAINNDTGSRKYAGISDDHSSNNTKNQ